MEKQTRVASATPAAFIQADVAIFKDLVQQLTGAPGGAAHKLRPKATVPFKLRERRKQSLGDLEIVKLGKKSAGNSPVKGPITPLGWERVRAESPPPVLLTLFPLTPQKQEY